MNQFAKVCTIGKLQIVAIQTVLRQRNQPPIDELMPPSGFRNKHLNLIFPRKNFAKRQAGAPPNATIVPI